MAAKRKSPTEGTGQGGGPPGLMDVNRPPPGMIPGESVSHEFIRRGRV